MRVRSWSSVRTAGLQLIPVPLLDLVALGISACALCHCCDAGQHRLPLPLLLPSFFSFVLLFLCSTASMPVAPYAIRVPRLDFGRNLNVSAVFLNSTGYEASQGGCQHPGSGSCDRAASPDQEAVVSTASLARLRGRSRTKTHPEEVLSLNSRFAPRYSASCFEIANPSPLPPSRVERQGRNSPGRKWSGKPGP